MTLEALQKNYWVATLTARGLALADAETLAAQWAEAGRLPPAGPAATNWQPMDQAPKEPGRYLQVQQLATFRWLPYKEASQQRRQGILGRWQRYTGYGWENAELTGFGWVDLPQPEEELRD